MRKRKILAMISPILSFGALAGTFSASYTIANYIDVFTVDTSKESFIDSTTQNFICYPLEKANQSDPDTVAIGWAKDPETCTGTLNIPETVKKGTGTSAVTYYVTCIAESGFRYCDFTSISFTNNNNRIEEIKSEAFYCCQNMTQFTMPKKCVNGIAPSTFMDCRNLTNVDMTALNTYVESNKSNTEFLNAHKYVIGDHAFTNCINLKGFTFPINLYEINESAFQKCKKIFGLFLPEYNGCYKISIGKYAFADCSDFSIIHMFKESLQSIDKYCFAQCEHLRIYYSGDPNVSGDPMASFDLDFRKKHVATNKVEGRNTYSSNVDYVPIFPNINEITMDDDHPGFLYFHKNKGAPNNPIYYQSNSGRVNYGLPGNPGEYASIYEFTMPADDVETPDFDSDTGILTIPNTLNGLPVKSIEKEAFVNNLNDDERAKIKGIVFNEDMIQIGDKAFQGCSNLATINFGSNSHLLEIGNYAFYSGNNSAFKGALNMPSNLLFIGQYAFANFKEATSVSLNAGLLIIGKCAFENLGESVTNSQYVGKLDLIIPETLRDGWVVRLNPDESNRNYYQSVGEGAFRNCPLIRYVTMTKYDGDVDGNNSNNNDNRMTSFGNQVFANCTNLLRFKANRRMMCLGRGMFENCKNLKEVFLSTAFINKVNLDSFIWGCDDNQSIFFSGNDSDVEDFKDLIVYVDGAKAPSRKTRQQQYYVWNSDPKTYINEYETSSNNQIYVPHTSGKVEDFAIDYHFGRLVVPTYFNADYNAGVMKYYNISTNTLSDSPTDDYSDCIALLNKNGNYIITKCYANETSIDLSVLKSSLSLNVTTIGSCAFSTLTSGNTASKIILPYTVTTIRDRAFYSVGEDGINTVTYKDSNGVEAVDAEQNPTSNICILPPGLTRIENFSFYNNDFEKVVLPESLDMIGNTAFTCSSGANSTIRSFKGIGNSSVFSYVDDGVYDKSTNTLLYYAANGTGTLDLSSETIEAIGARALAGTKYSSFVLPNNSVKKIFGAAFANNKNTTQISGLGGLEHIGYVPDTPEMWDDSADPNTYDWDSNFTVFDLPAKDFTNDFTYSYKQINTNGNAGGEKGVYKGNFALRQHFYRWLSSFGAFANCDNLETFNFYSFTSTLKKIGYGAFEGCGKLKNTTNGASFTYYKYYNGLTKNNIAGKITDNDTTLANNTVKITDGTGVVDLTNAKLLQSIGREAFKGCSMLKYFHLPLLYDEDSGKNKDEQANFYLGYDYWDKGSWYDLAVGKKGRVFDGTGIENGAVLVGECAPYASSMGGKYNSGQLKINTDLSNPTGQYPTQTSDYKYKVDNYDEIKYTLERYNPNFLPNRTYFFIPQTENDFDRYVWNDETYISSKLSNNGVRYWLYYGNPANHEYVLFEKGADVKIYLGV